MKAEDRFYIPRGVGKIGDLVKAGKNEREKQELRQLRNKYSEVRITTSSLRKIKSLMRQGLSAEEAFNTFKDKLRKL